MGWSWFGAVTFLVTIGGFWAFRVSVGSRNSLIPKCPGWDSKPTRGKPSQDFKELWVQFLSTCEIERNPVVPNLLFWLELAGSELELGLARAHFGHNLHGPSPHLVLGWVAISLFPEHFQGQGSQSLGAGGCLW